MAVELATALIWALRIVLPIILFCIYFKLQAPKDEDGVSRSFPKDTKNQYSRNKLLAHRKAVDGQPVPECMSTMTRIGQEQAPELFEKTARPGRGRGGASREDRPKEDRRERGPRKDKDGGERRRDRDLPVVEPNEAPTPVAEPLPEETVDTAAEKMHLESLLNYVAFNRKDQQRTFLLDEDAPPPPPPPKPQKKPVELDAPSATSTANVLITGEEAKKANDEAQMVLSGAIKFKRVDVSQTLYEQLTDQQVEIYEKTFALMIESSVLAQDLKTASDFLMKMEANGHSPDTELLDKVMDLYSQQKASKDKTISAKTDSFLSKRTPLRPPAAAFVPAAAMSMPSDAVAPDFGPVDFGTAVAESGAKPSDAETAADKASRTKLSSEAILFVPSFSPNGLPFGFQPPPPPGPPPKKDDKKDTTEDDGEKAKATTEFSVSDRTSLKATSKPFQPQGMVTFNPFEYTWTVDTSKSMDGQQQEKGKGKSKGKNGKAEKSEEQSGKDKGKAKGKGKEKAAKEPEKPAKKGEEPKKTWKKKA